MSKPYVTISGGMSGYYAVLLSWNNDHGGFYEPFQTGEGRYKTKDEAVPEAKAMAEAEEVEFRP